MRAHFPIVLSALVVASLVAAPSVHAQQQVRTVIPDKSGTRDGRYVQGEEGWFWYKEPPPPPKPKPLEPPKPGSPSAPKPEVLSSEWLRDNMDKYRYAAIDNPTKDNVEMYLLLQKLMMDKAEKFAMAHRQYAMLNPGIDETVANPVGGTARASMDAAQEAEMEKTLAKLGNNVGIWYFYRSDCQFCHRQNPVIEMLQNQNKITVVPISLDGKSSPDGLLRNWRPDRGQAQMLGVTGTPTLYLVNPDTKKITLLGTGVRTLPDLQRRILELAQQEKWITEREYDLAVRGLERRFLTEHIDQAEVESDPQKLLALLRRAAATSAPTTTTSASNEAFTPWTGQRTTQGTQR